MRPALPRRVRLLHDRLVDLTESERRRELGRVAASDPEAAERLRELLSIKSRMEDSFLRSRRVDAANSSCDPVKQEKSALALSPLLGRYRLDGLLGHGGTATVHRAHDLLLNEAVAVKVAHEGRSGMTLMMRREAAAMRLLRLPGVVELRDEGQVDGRSFIVTDLVEGRPFPGDCGNGAALESVVRQLLAATARLHEAGVVHGDLKPANVIVGRDGAVTLLDLGLSAFAAPRGRLSLTECWGTPRYLAPERLEGGAPTAEGDMHALGVMVGDSIAEACKGAPPTGTLSHLVDLAGRWRSTDPSERPSARKSLRELLVKAPSPDRFFDTPYLDGGLLDELEAELRAGRSVAISGGPGSGKTRCLQELARRLEARGAITVSLGPSRPEELPPLVTSVAGRALGSGDLASEVARRAERAGQDRAAILIVDDADDLDAEVTEVLDVLEQRLPVARTTSRPGSSSRPLRALSQDQVMALIDGPEPIARVRSRLAAMILQRTAGNPAAIVELVQDWIAMGWVEWTRSGLRLRSRGERLLELSLEGPSAGGVDELALFHRARAATDQPAQRDAASACLDAARRLVPTGQLARVRRLITMGLRSARLAEEEGLEVEALEELARIAIRHAERRSLELALHEVERSTFESASVRKLEELLRAAVLVARGETERGLELLDSPLLSSANTSRLQEWRWAVRLAAAPFLEPSERRPALTGAMKWAARHHEPELAAVAASWEGWSLYAEGQYEEAARSHEGGRGQAADPILRLRAGLDAACAWLEVGRHSRVERLVALALEEPALAEQPALEAKARWLRRASAYRRRRLQEPALELVAGARRAGLGHSCALIELTEAAFAWRAGRRELARDLAEHASVRWRREGNDPAAALARALRTAVDGGRDDGRQQLAAGARSNDASIGLQVLALVALGEPGLLAAAKESACRAGFLGQEEYDDEPQDVLSPREAAAILRGGTPEHQAWTPASGND